MTELKEGFTAGESLQNLKGVKLNKPLVDSLVARELYLNLEEAILSKYPELAGKLGPKASCTTLCVMITKSDYIAIGTSSCIDPKEYNEEKGKNIAKDRAEDQLFAGMAFSICLANN